MKSVKITVTVILLNIAFMPYANTQIKSYLVPHPLNTPQIFGEGIISTGDFELNPAFSPSGDTIYFNKVTPDFKTWTLCVSYFRNGQWSHPEVASFSGKYMDAGPFFSKDGRTLYFISDRPVKDGDSAKTDSDIWKVEATGKGWSKPIHLDPPINSSEDEYYPTLADNGTMYFASRRSGKGSDIYRCRFENGRYVAAENIGEAVNTQDNEFEPFIAPDESYLIFMATRPNGLKNAHLYISYNVNGVWTKNVRLPSPFNSEGTDWCPKVTRDGKYFYFISTRNKVSGKIPVEETMTELTKRLRSAGNGLGDIYQVDFSVLEKSMTGLKNDELTQKKSDSLGGSSQRTSTGRDGQHDFDFEIGTWKTHVSRLVHPLTGSTTWVEYEGTTVVRKVWNGRANLLELVADGPAGHFEGLSLRLYNPESHQWSLNFASINGGTMSIPTIGGFKNGRGEFFDQEPFNGRAILVRFVISDITPNSCHFEQAFSEDGGKTWEVNWIATDTRVSK